MWVLMLGDSFKKTVKEIKMLGWWMDRKGLKKERARDVHTSQTGSSHLTPTNFDT